MIIFITICNLQVSLSEIPRSHPRKKEREVVIQLMICWFRQHWPKVELVSLVCPFLSCSLSSFSIYTSLTLKCLIFSVPAGGESLLSDIFFLWHDCICTVDHVVLQKVTSSFLYILSCNQCNVLTFTSCVNANA